MHQKTKIVCLIFKPVFLIAMRNLLVIFMTLCCFTGQANAQEEFIEPPSKIGRAHV